MSKGAATHRTIVERAVKLASMAGLEGLTIGALADELELSKSGLFAHFRSKENLQIEVLRAAAAKFTEAVVVPALKKPRGEPRLRALFDLWLDWAQHADLPGGCPFAAAAFELDDQPGRVRDTLVDIQKQWMATLAKAVQLAVVEGHFTRDTDPRQVAFELNALMLGAHYCTRLLADSSTKKRTRAAFAALLQRARV